jgi:uncharacterized protein (DUF433 family)
MITPHHPDTEADQIEADMIAWSGCPDVERIPGKVSGQWIVVGTRILADGVVENVDAGVSLEELVTEVYPGLGRDRARRILAYARRHAPRPA